MVGIAAVTEGRSFCTLHDLFPIYVHTIWFLLCHAVCGLFFTVGVNLVAYANDDVTILRVAGWHDRSPCFMLGGG